MSNQDYPTQLNQNYQRPSQPNYANCHPSLLPLWEQVWRKDEIIRHMMRDMSAMQNEMETMRSLKREVADTRKDMAIIMRAFWTLLSGAGVLVLTVITKLLGL